jgi:hypothetical protein
MHNDFFDVAHDFVENKAMVVGQFTLQRRIVPRGWL